MNSWDEDMVRQNLCFATRSITYNMQTKKCWLYVRAVPSTMYSIYAVCTMTRNWKKNKFFQAPRHRLLSTRL